MLNVVETFNQFLEQQIELYGDDLVIDKGLLNSQNELIEEKIEQDEPFWETKGDSSQKAWIIIDAITRDGNNYAFDLNDKAGDLFVKILKAIQLTVNDLFIISIGDLRNGVDIATNRVNELFEDSKPKAILCFGDNATRIFFNTFDVQKSRNQVIDYKDVKVLTTFHPAKLLETPALKHDTWKDVQVFQKLIDAV